MQPGAPVRKTAAGCSFIMNGCEHDFLETDEPAVLPDEALVCAGFGEYALVWSKRCWRCSKRVSAYQSEQDTSWFLFAWTDP